MKFLVMLIKRLIVTDMVIKLFIEGEVGETEDIPKITLLETIISILQTHSTSSEPSSVIMIPLVIHLGIHLLVCFPTTTTMLHNLIIITQTMHSVLRHTSLMLVSASLMIFLSAQAHPRPHT